VTTENENQNGASAAPAPAQEQRPPRPQGQGGYQRGPRPGGYNRPGPAQGTEDGGEGAPEGQGQGQGQGGYGDRPGGFRSGGPGPRKPRRPGGKDRFAPRRKVCQFCVDQVREVDYKDFQRLRRYLSDRGKIEPRRKTGTCARHQRSLTTAIKRGRFMALLPYVANQAR